MKTKIVSSILAATLFLSFSACSGQPESSSDTSASGSASGDAPGDIVIEFLNQKTEATAALTKLIEDFESKNPGITINQVATDDGGTVFSTRAASGDFPQTFTTWPDQPDVHAYEEDGYYLDLSDTEFIKNVNDSVREYAQYNGKDYVLPLSLNTFGVFYNPQIFSDLGLSVPQTWSQFTEACKKIQAAGTTPLLLSDKDSWTCEQLLSVMLCSGAKDYLDTLVSTIQGKTTLDTNGNIRKVAEAYLTLRDYSQGDTLGMSYNDATNEFANGKAAMFIQGNWDITPIKEANPDLEFSMFPLPPVDESLEATVVAGVDCAFGAYSKAANMDAVMKWLEYLASAESAQLYADMDKSPSAIKGVTVDVKESAALVDIVNANKTFPWPNTYYVGEMQNDYRALAQAFVDEKNVDSFLEEFNSIMYNKTK